MCNTTTALSHIRRMCNMVRNYKLEQQFKIIDSEANKELKNVKILICATEEGVENEMHNYMESMFKDFASGFVDYLHNEGKGETENTWKELETMFSNYSENDGNRKGKRGWFK